MAFLVDTAEETHVFALIEYITDAEASNKFQADKPNPQVPWFFDNFSIFAFYYYADVAYLHLASSVNRSSAVTSIGQVGNKLIITFVFIWPQCFHHCLAIFPRFPFQKRNLPVHVCLHSTCMISVVVTHLLS